MRINRQDGAKYCRPREPHQLRSIGRGEGNKIMKGFPPTIK